MDIIDVFKELGKAEMELMRFFRDEMHRNRANRVSNECIVVPAKSDEYTAYIKTAIKKHAPHMDCLGIIRRMKRGTYVLNPKLFIPSKNMEEALATWESLDSPCNNSDDGKGSA